MLTKLPTELVLQILHYLEYDDLIVIKNAYQKWNVAQGKAAQSGIARTDWNALVQSIIERKTVVLNGTDKDYESSYYSNLYLISRSAIGFRFCTELHSTIKTLVLFHPYILFDLINFDNLTYLVIEVGLSTKESNSVTLKLKNLDRLALKFSKSLETYFYLDLPRLSFIGTNVSLNSFLFVHPHSVKKLFCSFTESSMKQFINLECFHAYNFNSDDLLEKFHNLNWFDFCSAKDLVKVNQQIEKALIVNPSLKAHFRNIRINSNLNPLQDGKLIKASADLLSDSNVELYDKYGVFLGNSYRHRQLEIKDFNKFSLQNIQKLKSLKKLVILNKITDDEKFEKLLSLPLLDEIAIRSSVDQKYLTMLANCKFLEYLKMDVFSAGDWLLKLKYLKDFETKTPVDLEFFKKMMKTMYYLNKISIGGIYSIKLSNGIVQCSIKDELILNEPKRMFLETIDLFNYWSDLFHLDIIKSTYWQRI